MNFENPPVPSKEQEKESPSYGEVLARIEALIGSKDCTEITRREDERGLVFLEIISVRENGDEDLYRYQRTDSVGEITATYFSGTVTSGEAKSGENLAVYDSKTSTRRDIPKTIVNESLPVDVPRAEKAPAEPASRENQESGYEGLLLQFTQAERVFGATSLQETIQRETDNYEAALKQRGETRPLLNAICTELIRLNDDNSYPPQSRLTVWHESGQLTQAQFNELNARRKHLANLLGTLQAGKITHNPNP